MTKSTAVDNIMTIITDSSLNDINTQNEIIQQIQNLYFLRLAYVNHLQQQRGCCRVVAYSMNELQEESKLLQTSDSLTQLREGSMQDIISKNQGRGL